jgi:hypothetical protein
MTLMDAFSPAMRMERAHNRVYGVLEWRLARPAQGGYFMRRSLLGFAGTLAALALAASVAPAQAGPAAERELLGIRIWREWREVLKKHGQPTRIEVGAAGAPAMGEMGQSTTGGLMGAGGAPGMPGMPGMPGGRMGMMMGGAAAGGGKRMPGAMGVSGMGGGSPMLPPMGGSMGSGGMGAPAGMPGGMGMGGGMGSGGMMGGGMSAPPMPTMGGMAGLRGMGRGGALAGEPGDDADLSGMKGRSGMMPGMMGMPGMGGAMGGGFGAGSPGAVADAEEGEVSWVYEKGPNTLQFLFNKDGRVIQIQSFGYKNGGVTSRGIILGDAPKKVYTLYGWPPKIEKSGNTMTLDYSQSAHVAFQLVDRKDGKGMRVVGITIAKTEAD